jgi:hypothetical protein
MEFFLIASGVGLLIGFGLAYLVVKLRDAFKRDESSEPVPVPVHDVSPSPR